MVLHYGNKKIEICHKQHLIFRINLDMHISDKITNVLMFKLQNLIKA